jgi:hypothetical protein
MTQHTMVQRSSNPSTGMAAAGAGVGGIVGGIAAELVLCLGFRLRYGAGKKGMLGEDPGHWRLTHIVCGAGTMLGAAYGAYLGAAPYQESRAVAGAMIGSGAVILPTIAINPRCDGCGWWIVGGGSFGAAVGAGISAAGVREPRLGPQAP